MYLCISAQVAIFIFCLSYVCRFGIKIVTLLLGFFLQQLYAFLYLFLSFIILLNMFFFVVFFFSCFALYKILTFTFTTTNHVTTYRCIVLYIQTLQLQVCIYICFILYVCMYIVIVFMHVYGIFLLLIIIVMARSIIQQCSVYYAGIHIPIYVYILYMYIYPSPFQIPNHTPCIMLSSSHMRNLRGENRVSIPSKSHCLPYQIEGIYNLDLD